MLRFETVAARLAPVFLSIVLASTSSPSPATGQVRARGVDAAADARVPAKITGRVLHPDGRPAAGALVMTDTGGQTIAGADGAFALEVDVPLDAAEIQVTAATSGGAGSGSMLASTRAVLRGRGATSPAGDLVLAASAGCIANWQPDFGEPLGMSSAVSELEVFDDGTGPALYASGGFTLAGAVPANRIAKWDGWTWSALGSGLNGSTTPMAIFDDGTGPALFVGGSFTTAGGMPANFVAKWGGSSWSPLGSGLSSQVVGAPLVTSMIAFDDGSGPALYVGSHFAVSGGVTTNFIARWNGSTWSALGGGMNDAVYSLAVFDDGSGPALHAAGRFTIAGGVPANRVAKWDGASWSALGTGLSAGPGITAYADEMTVFDDGSGPALFVGGNFEVAGGASAMDVAKWDGSTWSALGAGVCCGFGSSVTELFGYDDGSGPALYVCGPFTTADGLPMPGMAKWDGAGWSAVAQPVTGVTTLKLFDDGSGTKLYAGGSFTSAGGVDALRVAVLNPTGWSPLGTSSGPLGGIAWSAEVFDDGSGPALYVGGEFTSAGGLPANRVAKWDGSAWSSLGTGMSPGLVDWLLTFDDGSGEALYAAGGFATAGGVTVNHVAKWDGASWSALGGGMDGTTYTLAVFDDGTGPALHAGGAFTTAGGVSASRVAKWDGATWSPLGSGVDGTVYALAVYDAGSGPALYAGGSFDTAGGAPASKIAWWDGVHWSPLGVGLSTSIFHEVRALAVFEQLGGPVLCVGGSFTSAGGITVSDIAKWNGTSWSTFGSGTVGTVYAIGTFDYGKGEELYIGGSFNAVSGVTAQNIAKWNGVSWTALGSVNIQVDELRVLDVGVGPALYVSGEFTTSPAGDAFIAKYGCPWIASVPGCAANPATLGTTKPTAPLGVPLPLKITGGAAQAGLGLFYSGASGTDASGCGLVLSGLGELLLALVPTPSLVATKPLANGKSQALVLVPNVAALTGVTAHLQGVAIDIALPVPIELTNGLSVKLGP